MASKWLVAIVVIAACLAAATVVLTSIILFKIYEKETPKIPPASTTYGPESSTESGDCNRKLFSGWYEEACCKRSCPRKWKTIPLLVLSLDGFRADYLMQNRTSSIMRLRDCGVHTPYMYPSYPSKTFPNHYTIVTGLYPESHGIVDNDMYDSHIEPEKDRLFSTKTDSCINPQWWKEEPIWNTVIRNGGKSAAFYWPGSNVLINGSKPTYSFPYDKSLPFYKRIDQAIDWLQYEDSKRPSFIALYFDQPDGDGHRYGPDSAQVSSQLLIMDGLINYMMDKLYNTDLMHCINLVILADHGMQTINVTNFVSLHDYVPISEQTKDGMQVFGGPIGRIQLHENSSYSADYIINATECQDDRIRVYSRLETPKRLHYSSNPRIGDVLLDANPGITIWSYNDSSNYPKLGDHGYDYKAVSMHALFLARGPSFKQNYTVAPFQNIELYNLFSDLLGLTNRSHNNGTTGSLHEILQNSPSLEKTDVQKQPEVCKTTNYTICKSCEGLDLKIDYCNFMLPTPFVQGRRADDLCISNKRSLIQSTVAMQPVASQIFVDASTKMISLAQAKNCTLAGDDLCTYASSKNYLLSARSAFSYPLQPFDIGKNTCAADWNAKAVMYDKFYKDVWQHLQNLTLTYTRAFGRLLIISGVIYDYDSNGLADFKDTIRNHSEIFGNISISFPTHFYQIIIRCENGQWSNEGQCNGTASALSFVLPNRSRIQNCQPINDYLYTHTARVRDVELLTGMEFFKAWPFEAAVRLRIHINQNLW